MRHFKISLPLIAVVLGLGLSAFTAENNKLPKKNDPNHYFKLSTPSQPLQGSSYTEITEAMYNNIVCPDGDEHTCKLEASSATLPSTLADADGNDIPDETGVVILVPRKQ